MVFQPDQSTAGNMRSSNTAHTMSIKTDKDKDSRKNEKLTQVIQNFFSKAAHIIIQSRLDTNLSKNSNSSQIHNRGKVNKWFNLQLEDSDLPKEELRLWKSCHDLSNIPPMIIETYLDLRDLTTGQTLVLKDEDDATWTVAKGTKKSEVVLERWLIEFDSSSSIGDDELPLIYKQAIILFRGLYTYTKLLPTYKLKRKLDKAKLSVSPLKIGSKILDGNHPISSKGRIGLSRPIIHSQSDNPHIEQRYFEPVSTSVGSLKISVSYRKQCNFYINDNEELLSSHFLSLDKNKSNNHNQIPIPIQDDEQSQDATQIKMNQQSQQQSGALKRFSLQSNPSLSVSPGSNYLRESSPRRRLSNNTSSRPNIQPFKVGSIANSPPMNTGSSLERKISLTSNRSASNASLAALLRNSRGSGSSNNTNINISTSVPRSVSSPHGSVVGNIPVPLQNPSGTNDYNIFSSGSSGAPKFSSSFSSRNNRRNSTIQKDSASLIGTSDSDPLSGLYVDDDIGDFVKMIDSKTDLRLSSTSPHSSTGFDVLSRFQSLKNQHQQLGESVSASLILNRSNQGIDSRRSSRNRSNSQSQSPIPFYNNSSELQSIHSRLDTGNTNESSQSHRSYNANIHSVYASPSNSPSSHVFKLGSTTNRANSRTSGQASNTGSTSFNNSSLSKLRQETTDSIHSEIKYEDVFEDDDDDDDYHLHMQSKQGPKNDCEDDDDEDLLFAMSDMNLTKQGN